MTFYSYVEVSNNNSIKSFIKSPYIFICVVLIILAGIRVAQGADYWPYFKLFISANAYVRWNEMFSAGIEAFYILISKIVGYLGLPFLVLLFTYAILGVSLKSYVYYKLSPYPFLTLLYYYMPFYFFQESGHIRQGVAIALCAFSFQYIRDRKLLKFLFVLLISYYFHKTAIVFLPAYWIANMNISTLQALALVVISIIISPFQPYNWFGGLFHSLSTDTINEAFNSYQQLNELGFELGDIVKLIYLIILFLFDRNNLKNNPDKNYMKIRNLVIIYFCIYYAFRGNIIFSTRLPESYNVFSGILIAMIIKNCKNQLTKFLVYSYTIIYIYLLSIRYWENARELGFDQMNNIFTVEYYNNRDFTAQQIIN